MYLTHSWKRAGMTTFPTLFHAASRSGKSRYLLGHPLLESLLMVESLPLVVKSLRDLTVLLGMERSISLNNLSKDPTSLLDLEMRPFVCKRVRNSLL